MFNICFSRILKLSPETVNVKVQRHWEWQIFAPQHPYSSCTLLLSKIAVLLSGLSKKIDMVDPAGTLCPCGEDLVSCWTQLSLGLKGSLPFSISHLHTIVHNVNS